MKRMKQFQATLCVLLVSVICLIALSGCHGKRAMAAFVLPEKFDTSRQYEISFWAKNDTNQTQVAIYRKAVADFEALYPNILNEHSCKLR